MKKVSLLVCALLCLAVIAACGSGSAVNQTGYTYLTLVVADNGRSATVMTESRLSAGMRALWQRLQDAGIAQAAIPANVATVTITISAPDIEPITRTFTVAGQSSVTESFLVLPGNNRSIVVEAKDAAGSTQFRGATTVNLTGTPVTVPITMVNVAPPLFGGLVTATPVSDVRIDLAWNAASDNVTPPANMVYLVYVSTTAGGENFASPTLTTAPGATAVSVTGLTPATTYYFVVRARDQQGFTDSNVIEKTATTFQIPTVGSADAGPRLTSAGVRPSVSLPLSGRLLHVALVPS